VYFKMSLVYYSIQKMKLVHPVPRDTLEKPIREGT
jgi:hypothetical protein